jgi:XTP/dITP diphosphohydrolase
LLKIFFATSNAHKFTEAAAILGRAGIEIERYDFKHNEIRSDSLEEIALEAVGAAYGKLNKPVFVEDAGLFIDALNGFPGTYSGWAQRKLGNAGILKLLEGIKNRKAAFRSCIAFTDGKETKAFAGECRGTITEKERGKNGFGYDPVFVAEGSAQTFAENVAFKNGISHRYNSLLSLSKHIAGSTTADKV